MKNLSHYEERVLDQLYGPLERKEPGKELRRVCKFYREVLEHEENGYIKEQFKVIINSQLNWHLQSIPQFYHLDYFKNHYKELSSDFAEENIDANEKDFIEEYIDSQKEIINKTFTYHIEVPGYKSLEVTQFTEKGFLDVFIRGSKKKITFLENKLYLLNGSINEVIENNPYPLLFTSADTYSKFNEYTSKHIIEYYLDYSYLKKRLEHENLIHRVKDNDFMRILFEDMKLIKLQCYNDYRVKNKLSSLKKSSSASRENNFNNIFLD